MEFAKKVAIPISILNNILSPISVPMRNGILFIEKKLNVQKGNFSVDQLSQALELTSQTDTTDGEQKILEGIVTFGNTEVRQVMSPRIDVFALNIEEAFDQVMPKIVEKGYSRIPVYKENIDQIEGILFIKDLIPHIDSEDFAIIKVHEMGIELPFHSPTFRPAFHSFTIVTQGIGTYIIGNETFELSPNHIVICRPNSFFSSSWTEIGKVYNISFNKNFLLKYLPIDHPEVVLICLRLQLHFAKFS